MNYTAPSARAEAVTRRTYNRPLDENGTVLETWGDTVHRATQVHHRRLWEDAGGTPDDKELDELYELVASRKALVSGRTLWLGGTDYSTSRACSQFNCSYTRAQTVYELVDIFWLLLNGCGVGFRPIAGTLHGFLKPIPELAIVESTQPPSHRGNPKNTGEAPSDGNGYHWYIKVGDSAEAWAKSLGRLLNPPTCAVKKLTIDFSDCRGAGQRLKGYGWVCNGSKPLQQAYVAIFRIMNSKAGDLLDEIDLLNVVNWLGTVLSSRRSAQIAVMDYDHPRWEQFARAKTGHWICTTCGNEDTGGKYFCGACGGYTNAHRQQSNNSLVFWHKPTKREIRDIMQMIWDCGGSEPGFINGVAARNRAPWFDGLNPCVPLDTWIHTADGPMTVGQLIDTPFFAMVDGQPYQSPTGFVQTGVKLLLRVTLANGVTFRATDNHPVLVVNHQSQKTQRTEWRELGQLQIGDRVVLHNHRGVFWTGIGTRQEGELLGSLIGDGTLTEKTAYLDYWGESRFVMAESALVAARASVPIRSDATGTDQQSIVGKRRVQSVGVSRLAADYGIERDREFGDAVERTSFDFYSGFLQKWFDADGTVGGAQEKGVSVRLNSSSRNKLERAQRMLLRIGINSAIYWNRREAGYRMLPDGKGGLAEYWCEANHDLVIANDNLFAFAAVIGFSDPIKNEKLQAVLGQYKRRPNRDRFNEAIISIEAAGIEPVYDCTVPGPSAFDANGAYVHNCGEILLQSRGFCNLVTTAVSKYNNDFSGLLRALYVMGRANYRQTCVELHDGVLMPEWQQTNAALRLCGMSLTGISQAPWLTDYQVKMMRNSAVAGAYSMADELGLPKPKLVTTIKPEGTGSKIMDVTEGIHKPLGRYIMNWIIFPVADPMVGLLADSGYRVMDHPSDPLSKLICFPVDYSGCRFDMHGHKSVNLDTAVEQLDVYRRWNTLWTDHNSSITVSWDISELDDIVEWLYRNWNDFVAVSWLMRNDPTKTAKDLGYAYLPQEVVEEAEFKTYTSKLQTIDWSSLHGIHDLTMTDCAGGQCPVR